MWQSALTSSKDASIALGAFVEASEWLSERLKQDEIAVVPSPEVFTVLNPELRNKLVDYKSIWHLAGVGLRERGDRDRLQRLRSYFIDFLQGNWAVKYVVRDWGELYVTSLFRAMVSDDLMFHLREVKTVPFTLSTGWSSQMTIYEVVRYTTLFSIGLSYSPKEYSTIPSDVRIHYGWTGATIEKVDPRVGFYLPLEAGINASRQNYLTMQIKLDVEDLELMIGFYFDKNRDGKFSGYEIDYAESVIFNQTKLGWVKGEQYTIYQALPMAEDPIVQIGIIATGNKDGAITLSNLMVNMEITPEDVLNDASNWLSEKLKDDESALVPAPQLFSYANPELRYKLVDYRSLWASAGIALWASPTEVLEVRSYFIDFLKENASVKYIVRDWIDPYAERLFEAMVSDDLMFFLREVKALFFTLAGAWSRTITIYEVVRYTTLLAMNFSSPPKHFVSPDNATIWFDSSGATIEKVGTRVGFYLPLEAGINASRQNYLTMQIKLDVEDLELMIGFYFDKNRDGKFSGYEIDYAESVIFNQTKLGWVKGEQYTIYQALPMAEDPIVQIGIIATGDLDGMVILKDLTVYTETTSEV